ncbi:MAG: TspO/MBR family protein [Oscillospiraceae bacterium]
MKVCWKSLIFSLFISLGIGLLAGTLTKNAMQTYSELLKPELSPPAYIFPAVWIILYFLMGISAYLVFCTNAPQRSLSLYYYFIQLCVNFLWPLLFFNLQSFLLAFLWIILLWVLIILMIKEMYRVNKVAAYLQIPYLLWVTYAGCLNFYIAKSMPLSY